MPKPITDRVSKLFVLTCQYKKPAFTELQIFPSFVVIPACRKRESILFRPEGYPPQTACMTAKAGVGLTLGRPLWRGQATTRDAQKNHVGHATRSNPTHYLPVSSVTGIWQTSSMKKLKSSYQRHRFPSEIISHTVWLYHRFCLSFREVEELLAADEGSRCVRFDECV